MTTTRFKTALVILTILVTMLFTATLFSECDMMTMIAKEGTTISDQLTNVGAFADPTDYFNYICERSNYNITGDVEPYTNRYKVNPDGYGMIYYKNNSQLLNIGSNFIDEDNNVYYLTDSGEYYPFSLIGGFYVNSAPLNFAYYRILNEYNHTTVTYDDDDEDAVIVLGHARKGTGGAGSHPFWMTDDNFNDEVTYTFMHNGAINNDIKDDIEDYLEDEGWFDGTYNGTEHEQNTTSNDWIDSEMLFHYFMKFIMDHDGNVYAGIHDALSQTSIGSGQTNIHYEFSNPGGYWLETLNGYDIWTYHEVINFVLSDGQNLYTYRNSPSDDLWHELSYKEANDDFYAIKTLDEEDGTMIDQFDFVTIPRYGIPYEIPSFNTLTSSSLITSNIISNQTWSGTKFIVEDITISNQAVVTNNGDIEFVGNRTLSINSGELNLSNNSTLNLHNASEIIINGSSAEMNLGSGCTITGCTAGYYIDETYIPGDRIVAQNGGIISTGESVPTNTITIASDSDELWDGIFIETPADEEVYWFVNCNISGISNLSIANVSETQDVANLKLYLTDFTDAGQIVARHGHNLNIEGYSEFDRCNISNNHQTPIVAYDSPVYIQYALIEENGRDENGGLLNSSCDGIYLNYASGDLSQILYSVIQNNTGSGISTYYDDVLIDHATVQTNEQHGILTKRGTFDNLEDTTILNNDCAEYVGSQSSYNWYNKNNPIQDLDGNSGGLDQYILMAYEWDEIEESIDVRGNTINHVGNEDRFYPQYEAFKFVSRSMNPEAELLQTSLTEMRLGNYLNAETGFQQLISQYPDSNEAAVAIRGLLFIESYTDQDYVALINYIDAIQISEASSLYKAKEDVKTKSYMKDKEYEIAIERLEVIISTSSNPDDVILAMIDEGYCYMELASGGARSLPVNCTVRTETFDSYQTKVKELESQFSFFPEQENQNNIPVTGSILSSTNYPNPFNPSTSISFNLASDSQVSVAVYNIKGQKVKQLISEQLSSGQHTIEWNGNDNNNKSVASGIYFYKISAGKDYDMSKMLLLK